MTNAENFYQKIFYNNRKWVKEKLQIDSSYFEKFAEDQNPKLLFIGCSDSRVPANVIMGLEPGEVFVHRNIANMIVNVDMNAQSVIQYAVEVLNVEHIVVCGHYGCGGIRAALEQKDMGLLNGWLRNIRDVYRLHFDELSVIDDEESRFRRLVELNVEEQCINVLKTSFVLKSFKNSGLPGVHGWVYDMRTGLIIDINFNFSENLEKVQRVYRL